MGRANGILSISANFEPQIAAPFDARSQVGLKSDLTLATTWESSGLEFTYKGMLVVVTDDTVVNNGVYILNEQDYSNASNWKKLGENSNGNVIRYVETIVRDNNSYIQNVTFRDGSTMSLTRNANNFIIRVEDSVLGITVVTRDANDLIVSTEKE